MVVELRDGVWWIDLVGVNAYLVEDREVQRAPSERRQSDDDRTLTLVDAGSPWDRRALERAIVEVGGSVGAVDRVLVTHFDIDHVGTLHRMDRLDAPIYVGRADLPHLTGEEKPSWYVQKEALQRAVDWLRSPPSLPVEPVDDGDELGSFTAYHAPGHTPGHTVYVSEELSVAFLGDLVRERGGRFVAPPRLICHGYEQAKSSIVRLAEELPPFEAACQGHGVPFEEGGDERLAECARRIESGADV